MKLAYKYVAAFAVVAIVAADEYDFAGLDADYERDLENLGSDNERDLAACTRLRQKCRARSRRCRDRCGRPCLNPKARKHCKKLSKCFCGRNAGGKWYPIAKEFCEEGGGDVSVRDFC